MMTPEAALALYRKGSGAVVRMLVDQSATVEALQQRAENLRQQVEAPSELDRAGREQHTEARNMAKRFR